MKNKLFLLVFVILSLPVFSQCLSGDCIDGKGKYKMYSGDVYTGDFKNYERTGYGILEINSGSQKGCKYVGEFVSGKFHGGGKYTYTDGSSSEGIWKDNEFVSDYPKNYKKSKKNLSQNKSSENQKVVSNQKKSTSSVNKSVVTKTKPKKNPTTRKCECCGIVFKIENGWMYRESLGEVNVYQFGEPDELAYDILTTNIATTMGYSEDEIGYHTQIKYHSKRCAYDCGN